MLSGRIRILNLDDSLTRQREFLGRVEATTVDLTGIGPAARLWANQAQAAIIRAALKPEEKALITFTGSGDYHYVSALLLEQFKEPLSLVVFDHHPDWDTLPPRHGCGAWVTRALERTNLAKVLLVGNASDDLAFPSIITGNLAGVRSKRIQMLPYEAPGRQVWPFTGVPWNELKADPEGVFSAAIDRLPCRRVYVSIDKDCLTAKYALTNWEEGRLSLNLLSSFLRILRQRCEIAGLDITGEYSAAPLPSRWKSFCSSLDHPRNYTARGHPEAEIVQVNGLTNLHLVGLLRS